MLTESSRVRMVHSSGSDRRWRSTSAQVPCARFDPDIPVDGECYVEIAHRHDGRLSIRVLRGSRDGYSFVDQVIFETVAFDPTVLDQLGSSTAMSAEEIAGTYPIIEDNESGRINSLRKRAARKGVKVEKQPYAGIRLFDRETGAIIAGSSGLGLSVSEAEAHLAGL